MDFDDLNPPLAPDNDLLPGLIVWAFIIWGLVALARWIF